MSAQTRRTDAVTAESAARVASLTRDLDLAEQKKAMNRRELVAALAEKRDIEKTYHAAVSDATSKQDHITHLEAEMEASNPRSASSLVAMVTPL